MYSVERKYHASINWVCTKNSNLMIRCPARCVTNTNDSSIRLSHRSHNHAANLFKVHKPRQFTRERRRHRQSVP
ncbi:uncharacterized protein LOC117589643 [Drosophila guanche]|uniref:uncharacterized protein LOC117589643 n=1 Tax=Drosophila guanche TaxID=7266 RepID=UPI00147151C5|nr:uncharacterized protein LOC117589643 [Drosophila guanche]XP_034661602.1 uncharacterized protein LOC117897076 [Drosophila subobscura]